MTNVDIYCYDQDNGDLVRIVKNVFLWKSVANQLHHSEKYDIKVVNRFDGCVIYTLGV